MVGVFVKLLVLIVKPLIAHFLLQDADNATNCLKCC